MDTIAIPNSTGQGLVVTGQDKGNYNYNHGLSGKDAAFIGHLDILNALRNVTTDVHQTARDVEVNVEKSGRAAELATERTAAELRVQAATGFAANALAAATNTAAILAAQAECCCELKETIRDQADETRALINAIEKDRLTAELSDAKNEISFLKFKVAIPALPV